MNMQPKQDDLGSFRIYGGLTLLQLMAVLFVVGVVGEVLVKYLF